MPFTNRLLNRSLLSDFKNTELSAGYEENIKKWEVIVKFNGDILKIGEELGIEVEVLSPNYAILTLELSKLPELLNYTEIENIETPKVLSINLRDEIGKSCINSVKSSNQFDLTGKGTLIAIIDSGIDYTHPDFINEDGTSRILYMWDQTVNGTPPSGFTGGSEYDNQKINEALKSENPREIVPEEDVVGHGTAIAGIAAGNGRASAGLNVGIALEADLLIVKLGEKGYPSFAKTTELMRALKYVVTRAQELKMPLAVNISYGTNDGPHNGQSLFENFIDDMAQMWKTSICVASGNEGDAGHHYRGNIKSEETQEINFFYSGKNPSFYLAMWKNFVDVFTVELIFPNGYTTGEILPYETTRTYNLGDASVIINYGQPQFYNSFQEVFFQVNTPENAPYVGVYTVKIRASNIVDGDFDIYLPTVEEVGRETAFSLPEENSTLTIPSTAQNVITVGGYDSSREIISSFSGKGYTIDVVYVKPDLVAPSVNVITTQAGGGYGVFTGTSFAAPFVAGSVSLMMQWGIINGNDPFLYGEKIKSYLKRGAKRSPERVYPNSSWGYGTLCLYNSLSLLRDFDK